MPDYISGKRMEKLSLDRWENEGGKPSPAQTEMPEEFSSGKRVMDKKRFADDAGRQAERRLM